MLNPTGKAIRNDTMGTGHFGAPRRDRKHNGVDFLCEPGQIVISPIDGFVSRIAYPYTSRLLKGLEIIGERVSVIMFYIEPAVNIQRSHVRAGEVIGTAQDVSKAHGNAMKPHVHLKIERFDPMLLIDMP